MPQTIGNRSTNQAVDGSGTGRLVRYVGLELSMLEPDTAPLLTFLNKLGGQSSCDSPRIEWFEDDYVGRTAQNGSATVGASASSTTVTVTDGTLFVGGDVFVVPQPGTSSTAPEQVLVSSVSGNVLTVVRAFAGSTVQQIDANASIYILGQAHAEGGAVPSAKTTTPSRLVSYTEIFKKTVDLSNTSIAARLYGAPNGERKRLQEKALKELKIDINRQFLFGKASEDLTGATPRRTTMGINSVVSTNVTNAGGTISRRTIETFAQQAFRYGNKKKLLLACPKLVSAFSAWGTSFMQTKPSDTEFGVAVSTVTTGHGQWMLVRDWMLQDDIAGKNGFGGWAFSLDFDEIEYKYLNGNGENRNIAIYEDVKKDGTDAKVDQILGECGLVIRQEKKHAKLYNISDYLV